MGDSIFRSSSPVTPMVASTAVDIPVPEGKSGEQGTIADREPLEPGQGSDAVLSAIGISDDVRNLTDADKENLAEFEKYVFDILGAKNSSTNSQNIKKTMDSLKEEMGLSNEADPSVVLDRIGGVVKAWKNLSFIKDVKDKRNLLFKLARMQSSKDMNKAVFEAMKEYQVWE